VSLFTAQKYPTAKNWVIFAAKNFSLFLTFRTSFPVVTFFDNKCKTASNKITILQNKKFMLY